MVLDDIQAIVNRSVALEVRVHPVSFAPAKELAILLTTVLSSAGEALDHDYLATLLRPLKSYAYLLAQLPLPLNYPELYPATGIERLRAERKRLEQVYPALAPKIEQLLESLELLSIADDAPLLEKIVQISDNSATVILVDVRNAHMIQHHLESIGQTNLSVVTSKDLRKLSSYDTLAVAGPLLRYPDHVLLSPRAFRIEVVRYDWTRDIVKKQYEFTQAIKPHKLRVETLHPPKKEFASPHPQHDEPLIDLEDLRPSVNVDMIARREQGDDEHELVKARLVVLEDELGVFLEESGSVFTVQPELPVIKRVSSYEVTRLSVGDYVVLRTEGGGDYVADVANRLLGYKAATFRQQQITWKSELKKQIAIKGIETVAKVLRAAGVFSASRVNLRNWTSAKNLGMQRHEDFEAVLNYLDLAKDANRYKEALQGLRKAHRSAGHQIRKQLISRVSNLDPATLEQTGHLDIELEDADGGRLSIYRIRELPEGSVDIPEGRLGDLISLS